MSILTTLVLLSHISAQGLSRVFCFGLVHIKFHLLATTGVFRFLGSAHVFTHDAMLMTFGSAGPPYSIMISALLDWGAV